MADDVVETLIDEWHSTRDLTYALVEEIPFLAFEDELPRPGLDTLSIHVYEMARVQMAYTEVMDGRELDFSKVPTGEGELSPDGTEDLLEELRTADEFFEEVVAEVSDWDESVELFGKEIPKSLVIELMIRHESLHHGQFIAFGYQLGVNFPPEFERAWALPSPTTE